MIDHIAVPVSHYQHTRDAWAAALAPLGWTVVMELSRAEIPQLEVERTGGLGHDKKPMVWLRPEEGTIAPVHVAITADTRAHVDTFHAAALRAGLKDNGAPGLRPHYHPSYYGAFALDADGHNLEAVCHEPE